MEISEWKSDLIFMTESNTFSKEDNKSFTESNEHTNLYRNKINYIEIIDIKINDIRIYHIIYLQVLFTS